MNEIKLTTKQDVMETIDKTFKDMHADFSQALNELASIPSEFEAERDRVKAEIKVLQKYSKRMYELYTEASRMKG